MANKITITQPDDWHLHVRTGNILKAVLPHTARQFARAIIMPNLTPPVSTVDRALRYRAEIIQAIPENTPFTPLMTLYLTDATSREEIEKAAQSEHLYACKLYPAGATTNSDAGVSHVSRIYPVLEAMQQHDLPLLVHGEATDSEYDIFDREKIFIEQTLDAIVKRFPALRIVVEHVTTQEAVQFVQTADANIAATITPQHLLFNRNALLAGGIRPHHYCLPILKREKHRQALVDAAVSGSSKFFLGTDSAPHLQQRKESACGCAGCYSAHAALELYCEVFDRADAMDRLEGFASFHGADFYRLPRNRSTITLVKNTWKVPSDYPVDADKLIPLKAGETLAWRILEQW
ncbi:dihydroorotase [Thiolapillus sp.]|uniref:dihydroorotase n=1 Tax=Thiolapillus sp. TaxID=2017437 RepID=UPI003AF99F94